MYSILGQDSQPAFQLQVRANTVFEPDICWLTALIPNSLASSYYHTAPSLLVSFALFRSAFSFFSSLSYSFSSLLIILKQPHEWTALGTIKKKPTNRSSESLGRTLWKQQLLGLWSKIRILENGTREYNFFKNNNLKNVKLLLILRSTQFENHCHTTQLQKLYQAPFTLSWCFWTPSFSSSLQFIMSFSFIVWEFTVFAFI